MTTPSARSGIKWSGMGEGAAVGLQLIQTVVLTRLLPPEDFGLMAMVMTVQGLVQAYQDMGVSNAIIHRQDTTRAQLSSLYWLNVFCGTALAGLMVLLAPVMAWGFGEPRLTGLITVMALAFPLAAIGQQFQVLLQKELRIRTMVSVETTAAVSGTVVSIMAALAGMGVHALIVGYFAMVGVRAIAFALIGWSRWRPAFHFRRRDLDGYLSFGLYQMGERSINYLNSRLDQILIGAWLGPQALGYYYIAHMLVMQPVMRLAPAITKVAFPVFARIQNDIVTLRERYMLLVRAYATLCFPVLLGLAVTAPWLVPMAFGQDWLPVVPLVQILAGAGMVKSVGTSVGPLLLARGRADLTFAWNVGLMVLYPVAIVAGALLGGVEGVALSILVLQIGLLYPNYHYMIRSQLGPCLGPFLGSIVPVLGIAALMAVLVHITRLMMGAPSIAGLAALVGLGALAYGGLYWVLQRRHARYFASFILDRTPQATAKPGTP